jgi:hypothetical protein
MPHSPTTHVVTRFALALLLLASTALVANATPNDGAIPVFITDSDGEALTVALVGQRANVSWAVPQDGTFVDRLALFHKYDPCDALATVTFAASEPSGAYQIELPADLPAAETFSLHVFKGSASAATTASCAWTNLAAYAFGSADVTITPVSAVAFDGGEGGRLAWSGVSLELSSVCSVSQADIGFSLELWLRCAGDCSNQVVVDSSSACGFRVRIVAPLQVTHDKTTTLDLTLATDEFYSRNAYSYLPGRTAAVQLEIFGPSGGVAYNITSNTIVADRRWHHVAVTRDADGGTHLIVDGVPSRTHGVATGLDWRAVLGKNGSAGSSVVVEPAVVVVGGPLSATAPVDERFVGFLSEVRAWDSPLDKTAVVDVLRSEANGTTAVEVLGNASSATLLGRWPLATGTRLADASGHASVRGVWGCCVNVARRVARRRSRPVCPAPP